MSDPSPAAIALEACAAELRAVVAQDASATASADLQLRCEAAVGAGAIELADGTAAAAAVSPTASGRAILASDLLLTVDLVLRALQNPN